MLRARKKSYNANSFSIEKSGLDENNLNLFFNMIYDRQLLWKKRFIDHAPPPWTDNEIFREYKFCNLYREHDRSSQWEIRNIIMDDSLSDKNLVWKILVYRSFNNPETFARAIDKWQNGIPNYEDYSEDEFAEHISIIRDMGLNPFTNAYNISGAIVSGGSVDNAYCHTVIPAIHKSMDAICMILETAANPEQIITFLMTLPGVSSFVAHEFYQDLTYISIYTDRAVMRFNQNDYTNLGPGSSQGVRLIFPKLKGSEQISCYSYLQDIAEEKLEEIAFEKGELMPYTAWNKETHKYDIITENNLSLNQIEGALCEFSKYVRILRKTGRPRCPKFEPRTNYIIVEQSVCNQEDFFTDMSELIGGRRLLKRKQNNSAATAKKFYRNADLCIDLNLKLDLQNIDFLLTKLKQLW